MEVLQKLLTEVNALGTEFDVPEGKEEELCFLFLRLETVCRCRLEKQGAGGELLLKAAYADATQVLGWGPHDGVANYLGGAAARLSASIDRVNGYDGMIVGHLPKSYLYLTKRGWAVCAPENGKNVLKLLSEVILQMEVMINV